MRRHFWFNVQGCIHLLRYIVVASQQSKAPNCKVWESDLHTAALEQNPSHFVVVIVVKKNKCSTSIIVVGRIRQAMGS